MSKTDGLAETVSLTNCQTDVRAKNSKPPATHCWGWHKKINWNAILKNANEAFWKFYLKIHAFNLSISLSVDMKVRLLCKLTKTGKRYGNSICWTTNNIGRKLWPRKSRSSLHLLLERVLSPFLWDESFSLNHKEKYSAYLLGF